MKKVSLNECPNNIIGIYKIDYPNGKIYIGQSKNIKNRIKRHNELRNCASAQLCEKAIAKYGIITEFIILEEGNFSQKELNEKERYWINYYDARNRDKGYNIKDGGNGSTIPPKFSENMGKLIAQEIINDKHILFQDLSLKYNCSIRILQKINCGISPYYYKEFTYPLRTKDESRVLRAYIPNTIVNQILSDLRETSMTMTEIGEKYGYCRNTISDINKGKKSFLENYDYPARKTKIGHK